MAASPRARRLAWETVRANEKNEQLVASLEGALEAEVRPGVRRRRGARLPLSI